MTKSFITPATALSVDRKSSISKPFHPTMGRRDKKSSKFPTIFYANQSGPHFGGGVLLVCQSTSPRTRWLSGTAAAAAAVEVLVSVGEEDCEPLICNGRRINPAGLHGSICEQRSADVMGKWST